MTWIIHKGYRKQTYNSSCCSQIFVDKENICLEYLDGSLVPLEFGSAEEATQAFGYLLEAIKRGDRLVHL